ncbi:hypothetical protein DC522_29075 [Microvirga sp. KLBC 81]|nr:hypothetical protein DC522_29075 [Microvirga sp. KLBC 81]
MTIIDPHHALSGQQFELVSVHSARGPSFVVIALPDGRRRSVRRSITDLAGATSTNRSDAALRVSVRTLLPLAQHLAAIITASAQEGIGHGQTRPFAPGGGSSGSAAPEPLQEHPASTVAEPPDRDPDTDGAASSRTSAADAPDQGERRW